MIITNTIKTKLFAFYILSEEVKMPSVSVKDVNQQDFTVALAAHFKKSGKMKVPEWVDIVKTNPGKELVSVEQAVKNKKYEKFYRYRLPMTRTGTSSDVHPSQDTFISGELQSLKNIWRYLLLKIFSDPPLECPPSARSTVSAEITAASPPTG